MNEIEEGSRHVADDLLIHSAVGMIELVAQTVEPVRDVGHEAGDAVQPAALIAVRHRTAIRILVRRAAIEAQRVLQMDRQIDGIVGDARIDFPRRPTRTRDR
jgi:hypothetical protein